MLKLFMIGASAAALASTAAFADPTEAQTAPTQPDAPQYTTEAVTEVAPITPLEVTTRSDSEKLAQKEFTVADANADGVIDEAEFVSYAQLTAEENIAMGIKSEKAAPVEKAFVAIANGDKKISAPELTEARTKSFDAADANRDNMLDAVEQQKFASLVAVKPPKQQ